MLVEAPTLAAFAVTAAAIIVSPGPDTFVILRHALAAGRPAGLAAVLGVQLGLLIHTVLAAAGVSALIASSPALYRLVGLAGAAYLAWIGWQGLRARGRLALDFDAGQRVGVSRAWREALLTNLSNPKVIVLFLALYPNFIVPAHGRVLGQLAVLSAVLIGLNVLWQASLACAADASRRWLGRTRVRDAVTRLTGAILILFALALAYEHIAAWIAPA